MPFNTIQYCIDHSIPCFTFPMDHTKTVKVKWSEITVENMPKYLSNYHNGFAILTGDKYIVIDFDKKHSPPQEIYEALFACCQAVEKTPGGYHFWFLRDVRTAHFTSTTDITWDNVHIKGLDIRANGGICYVAPSQYKNVNGVLQKYVWCKGDLSRATTVPSEIVEHLSQSEFNDSFSFTLTKEMDQRSVAGSVAGSVTGSVVEDDMMSVLSGLSQERCDTYSNWIKVGMALKHSGYSCEMWDEWSKRSTKYQHGSCHTAWNGFKERDKPITVRSLYAWLKEDNYDMFMTLQGKNQAILENLLVATNASIADAFYDMNPFRYLYSTVDGWYVLQENRTWICTGSTDVLSIPNLLNTIRKECCDVLGQLMLKLNKKKEEDDMKHQALVNALKRVSSSSFLRGVVAFLSGLYYVPNVERQFNEKRHLFAFLNGVLDTTTQTFRAIEPDDYITVTCGYEWRDIVADEKEMVLAFLQKIFPKEGVLRYILLALSRTLVGSNSEQLFHVFTGMGANGKSCLMDLCKIVFGDYYQTFTATYLTKESDGKDKPLPEFAAARYARMLVTSEPDVRDKFQVNIIKNITGNEEVSFRGMYAKMVTKYIPQFKLWILTNDMPRLSKFDQAIERRMRCIHFSTRFVYAPKAENEALRDDSLGEQFKTVEGWKYGLLGLLLDAFFSSQGLKLEMPEEVREFTDAYMLENNPVGAWLRLRYEMTGRRDDMVQKTELYQAFLDDTGVQKTQKAFSEDMIKCNIGEKKNSAGIRFYFGLLRKAE